MAVIGSAKPIYDYSVSQAGLELVPLTPLAVRETSPYTDEGKGEKYGRSY